MDLDFYKKINNLYQSSSIKETQLFELRREISDGLQHTLDYEQYTVIDGIAMPLVVMKASNGTVDSQKYKNIEAPLNTTFNLGSKVKCYGQMWLVTSINYNQQIKLTGQMQLCNYKFPFQDLETGEILHEDCVVYAYDNTASGETGNDVLRHYDTRRKIRVQYNKDTAKIERGRRFFIDLEGVNRPKIYILSNIDCLTYLYNGHGFLEYTFMEEQSSHITDRPDLMIADYITPITKDKNEGWLNSEIIGRKTIKCGGSTYVYEGVFYDEKEKPVYDIKPLWEVDIPESAQDKIIWKENEGKIEITCANDLSLVGERITLKLSEDMGIDDVTPDNPDNPDDTDNSDNDDGGNNSENNNENIGNGEQPLNLTDEGTSDNNTGDNTNTGTEDGGNGDNVDTDKPIEEPPTPVPSRYLTKTLEIGVVSAVG